MPSSKKIAWSQLKVGIMAMAALLILFSLIVLMTGAQNPFAASADLKAFMADSAAITTGSDVRLNGILVGRVKRIALSGETQPNRIVRMDLEIEEKYLKDIPVDSIIGFSAENVLGSKFLNIKRGKDARTVKPGDELKSRDDKELLEVLQSTQPILESMQSILGRLDKIVDLVEAGKGSLGLLLTDDQFYKNLNLAAADIEKITSSLAGGGGTIGRLLHDDSMYDDVRRTLGRLDAVVTDLQSGQGSAGKFLKDPALYDELKKTSAEIRTLVADLNAGKGTAGKFLKDEALNNRLLATLDHFNTTIDRMTTGEGTLAQLIANPALYNNLAATSDDFRAFMKEFRANPKKFLTIQLKLF